MPGFPIGLYLPQDIAPEQVITIARAAERAGLDSVWAPDHVHQFPDKRKGRLEAWMLLSAVAAETSTIRLGTGVCNVQLRNPRLLVKMACTLDILSGGRLNLVLGTGGNMSEMRAYGYAPASGAAARERLLETVRVIRNLSTGEWEGTLCRPTPIQQPLPIAIAADHPATMRIVAEHGEWWYANLAPPDVFAERNRRMTDVCLQAERDPRSLKRNAHVLAILGETQRNAEAAAKHYASQRRARLFEMPHIVGDANTAAEGLQRYREAGADRICLYVLNIAEHNGKNGVAIASVLAQATRVPR